MGGWPWSGRPPCDCRHTELIDGRAGLAQNTANARRTTQHIKTSVHSPFYPSTRVRRRFSAIPPGALAAHSHHYISPRGGCHPAPSCSHPPRTHHHRLRTPPPPHPHAHAPTTSQNPMANDMRVPYWKSLASASSSRLSSFKDYLAQRDRTPRAALNLGGLRAAEPPDAAARRQTWKQWAGQKIARGGAAEDAAGASAEKVILFPGWAARRYHALPQDAQQGACAAACPSFVSSASVSGGHPLGRGQGRGLVSPSRVASPLLVRCCLLRWPRRPF